MSDRSHDEQRKHLEYLMSKNPEIVLSQEQASTDKVESKDKAQKRSFDYSNYLRNKRHQLQIDKEEKEKLQSKNDQDKLSSKMQSRQQQLEARTAKKRAERKKRLQKQKRKEVSSAISADEHPVSTKATPSTDTKDDSLSRLKDDEELRDLGLS